MPRQAHCSPLEPAARPFTPVAARRPTAARHSPRPASAAHPQGAGAAPVDRRELLLGAGALAASLALQQGQPAAAADCELKTAASGMQWCDVAEGTGDAPVSGARS